MKLIVVAVLIAAVMIVGFFVWWMQRRKNVVLKSLNYGIQEKENAQNVEVSLKRPVW